MQARRAAAVGFLALGILASGAAAQPSGVSFHTVTPCRLIDTREPVGELGGPALPSDQTRLFRLTGRCGIPATASAVSVNVTAVAPTGNGHLTAFPGDAPPPLASILNFRPGLTRSNNAILPLAADGSGTVAFRPFVEGAGTLHLTLDVNGYFIATPGNLPPMAHLAVSPVEGEAPLAVVLNASGSTDLDGVILRFGWDFGDGTGGEGPILSHVFGEPGTYRVAVAVIDDDGALNEASTTVTVLAPGRSPDPPEVEPPASPTDDDSTTLAGRALPGATVEVTSSAETVTTAAGGDGSWSATVRLVLGEVNRLFVTVVDAAGRRSAPTMVVVVHDREPPELFVDAPPDGASTAAASVTVAGRVGDRLSGGLGLAVTVDGQAAIVASGVGTNGTFDRPGVPLSPGLNLLTVVATDALGNRVTRRVAVTRVTSAGPRLEEVSGGGQTGTVGQWLPQPLTVRLVNAAGVPVVGRTVTFALERSDGRLAAQPSGPGDVELPVATDAQGRAIAYWTLGSDSGCANQRVRVATDAAAGALTFFASATAAPGRQIAVGSGDRQVVEAGAFAPEPLRVWVSDGRNEAPGVPVTFTVVRGGGQVAGQATTTVLTSRTGHVEVPFRLGPDAGENLVEASFSGNQGAPASFALTGLARQAGRPTSLSGLVIDNAGRPIGAAHCVLESGGHSVETVTDVQGRFTFTGVEPGPAHLHVDGATATTLDGEAIAPGRFPSLGFRPLLVPEADNTLPAPVRLPPLDPANARLCDNSRDMVLTVAGVEGLRMTIRAGSMRRADGTQPTPGDPEVCSLNAVHVDDVPMPVPDGAAPPFAWTLQPAGAHFDPPIEISLPNMAGLSPGAVAYFLSFDHATERFEIVATGQVTPDGRELRSDPGSGIATAGWGGICPPYPNTGTAEHDPLAKAKEQMREDYDERRDTAAAALSHQILCLGETACGTGPTPQRVDWADGFIAPLLADVAEHRSTDASLGDRVCENIPGWLVQILATPQYLTLYTTRDLCALAAGYSHFEDELGPGFERHVADQLRESVARGQSEAAAKQRIREQHEQFLHQAVVPCFDQVQELKPLPRAIAQFAVPRQARELRESTIATLCRQRSERPLRTTSLATATREELFSPELEAVGTLRVRAAGGAFFLPAGTSIQLHVSDPAGNDLTPAAAGTLYFAAVGDGSVTVSPDGLLTVAFFPSAHASSTPVVHVYAGNGTQLGIGQFALADTDADGDGLADSYERRIGLDPAFDNGPGSDLDGDGAGDALEALSGSDPRSADSDGDGVSDGAEITQGSDPLDATSRDPVLGLGATVAVAGRTAEVGADGSFRIANIPAGPALLRATAQGIEAGSPLYGRSPFFEIVDQQTTRLTDPLVASRQPPPAVVALTAVPDASLLTATGAVTQLRVSARLADGTTADVTARSQGTTYLSSNPEIATVDAEGRVTAATAGTAFVTTRNEGASAVVRLRVSPGDPLTTVVGQVELPGGAAAAGARVTVPFQGLAEEAGADGGFMIAEVTTAGPLTVTARRGGPGGLLFAARTGIAPVPGGTTEAGVLSLAALNRTDADADGAADGLEILLGLNPGVFDSDADGVADGREDRDGDFAPDVLELLLGTDLDNPDSDGDGALDGLEDSDGDGLPDPAEAGLGTDPSNLDTDGDGFGDGAEVGAGADPLDPARGPLRTAYATVSVHNAVHPAATSGMFLGAPLSVFSTALPESLGAILGPVVSVRNEAAPEAISGLASGPAVSVENLAPVP